MSDSFRRELAEVINRYSQENSSGTPDFILADYLIRCLETFNTIMAMRRAWYGEPEHLHANEASEPVEVISTTPEEKTNLWTKHFKHIKDIK